MQKILFCFLFFSFLSAFALDFKTKSGKEYKDAGIGSAGLNGVEVILPAGSELIPLEEVSDDLLNKLSPKRRAKIKNLILRKKEQPQEKQSADALLARKKSEQTKAIAKLADQQLEGVLRWLKVYRISRNPPDDAKRFSLLCETFVREMRKAESEQQKADAMTEFQKKVREGNFTGQLSLAPPQGPVGNYIQNSPFDTNERTVDPVPRGARYYKKNGQPVSRTRIQQ